MSLRGARAFLAASLIGTASTVYYVHWRKEDERQRMRQGVLRDIERVKQKRRERGSNSETPSK